MSFIGQIKKKTDVEIPIPPFSRFVLSGGLQKNETGAKYTKNGILRVEEERRRSSKRWDEVPIKFLRPVRKRKIADVGHVAATRLVC